MALLVTGPTAICAQRLPSQSYPKVDGSPSEAELVADLKVIVAVLPEGGWLS